MPIIQPTTPTKAGWAQSFDTSGIAAITAEEKEKKNKRITESMMEYDPKGVWVRDIPEFKKRVEAVNNYAMAHNKELASPAQNIETQMEFQRLKNDVKNFAVGSMAAKEQYHKATQMYTSGSGRFMTDQNREILDAYRNTPTAEQYADMTAFQDVSSAFDRNVQLRPAEYTKTLTGMLKDTPPEMEGTLNESTAIISQGKHLDRETAKEGLRTYFEAKNMEGQDLQYHYGEGEEGLDAFTDDVMKRVNTSPEYGTTRIPTKSEKAPTSAEKKAAAAVIRRTGSGHTSIETKFTEDNKVFRYTDDAGNQQDAVKTWGLGTVGGEDNVMMFQPDLRISKNITEGQDMTTGQMLKPGEGKRYKYQIPLERATYMTAKKKIEYTYTDKNGKKVKNVFEAGEALPDFEKMYRDGVITKNQFNDIAAKSRSEDGYIVYASNEQLDYFSLAEGEDVMNTLEGKGGRMMRVPAYTISPEVDQQLAYKHGKTQADYGYVAKPKTNVMAGI